MIDLKQLRQNPELYRAAVANKNEKTDIDALLELDEKRRKLQFEFDTSKARQNQVSQEIAQKKRNREDASELLAEMSIVAENIKTLSSELGNLNTLLEATLLTVPNLPQAEVPVGNDESFNRELRRYLSPPSYSFPLKDQLELATSNRFLDFQRGAKISGSGFPVYTAWGAKLERAIISFMLEYHIQKHGYQEVATPYIVNMKTMTGTGQLPKLENDMYHIDEDDLWLIPTAEVSVTNLHADEVLPEKELPIKYVAYSPCFRRESGSYGKDTRGLQRVHQFNKVEMVRFVHPDESYAVLQEMVSDAEDILKAFGLHYRVIELCTGDLSFASAKTYDLEVWAPGSGKYLEVSSVSNFEDFQARRANIRFRDKDGKLRFVHTLNGSGVATPRLMIALIETYQNQEGGIDLPDILKPWLELKV
ncbi:MAG: serine--tRNA ligase [Candidatus Cloacimonetes bacterium]|nr:serine--tRNA ligase [Candidatus Cloacimonadota bacterium]